MLKEISDQFSSLDIFFRVLIGCLILSTIAVISTSELYYAAIFLVPAVAYLAIHYLKSLFFLLIFTIPLSINLDITSSLTTDFPDEMMMWVLLPAVFLLVLSKPQLLPERFWNTPVITIITLLFLWSVVTTIFSTDIVPSVKYLLAKVWYIASFMILAFLVFREPRDLIRTFGIFLFSFSLFFLYSIYRQYLNGFDFETVNDSIMPFYHNHVNFSATISMLIPFVLLWYSMTRPSLKRCMILGYLVMLLLGLYFSYGRGAWLATITAGAMYVLMRLRLVKPAVILSFLFLVYAVIWITDDDRYLNYRPKFEQTHMHDNLSDHIVATFQGSDVSSMERVHRWIASVRMAQERPVLGVGPNNFYANYRDYVVHSFRTWVSRNMERSTSHNYFLLMLTEQGFPAMILYALLIYASLAYAQRIYHRSDSRIVRGIAMAIACSLAAFYVNNLLSELIESDEMGSIYYMSIAALVALDLYESRYSRLSPEQ